MASETWCIVHAHGVMRAEVSQTVATGHLAALSEWHGWRAVRVGDGPYLAATEAMGDSAREAVARLAVGNGLAVREILAPGEPTRAELIAERDEARAELARLRTCDGYFADRDRDAAWTAGAEAMREAILDAELDDELAAAQDDADADLVHLLTCPIPRDEDGRDELVGRLAARLAMIAIERRETDHSQVDVRDDYAADRDALAARIGAVLAGGAR